MVAFYKHIEGNKFVATNQRSCIIITKWPQMVSETIHYFPFKNTSEVYVEISEAEFAVEHDAILARTIDILDRKGNGVRALLPDA